MLRILVFCGFLLAGYFFISDIPISHEPGIKAPNAPVQTPAREGMMFMHKDYVIQPLAEFEVHARVLSRERYFLGRESDLAKFDLALGWGQMSDENILSHFSISQSGRWYWWKADKLPIPKNEVIRSSANMHMIAADDYVARQIKRVRPGAIVKFSGYLVEVKGDDGWKWRSSLTRLDSGGKACEVVFVKDFEIVESDG
ncbi:MAG: hypothetical protein AB8G77_20630 [Rhodothermales bacterium]